MATYEEISNRLLKDPDLKNTLELRTDLSDEEQYNFIHRMVALITGYKKNPRQIYFKKDLPTEYMVIDLETTGFSNNDEIIQLSAIHVKNESEIDSFNQFVKPQTAKLAPNIAYLTSINPEDLHNAPTIDQVLPEFQNFIEEFPIVGHNISFDARFLFNSGCNINPKITVDTVSLAQFKNLDTPNNKLETLKDYYGISERSHNSLSDCRTTAIIFENLRNNRLEKHINNEEIPQIFSGLKFCVTGQFSQLSRQQIKKDIISRGGKIMSSVGKSTNYLVEGVQIANNLTDGVHSRKELDYIALKSAGYDIQRLDEQNFINLLSSYREKEHQNAK